MTTVTFINQDEWEGIEVKSFDPFIDRFEKVVDCLEGELNVIFVNDVYIQALNKSYRDKDKPTDVLSFNYENENEDPEALVGEIYISIDTAKKQAKEKGHSLQEELEILFVHGFLHIHGHDHEEDDEYKKMYDLECKVLGKKLPFILNE